MPLQQAMLSVPAAAPVRESARDDRDRGGFRISGGGLFAICAFAFLMSMMTILGARWLSSGSDQQAQAPAPAVTVVNQQPAPAAPQPEAQDDMVINLEEVPLEGDPTKKPSTGTKTPATTTTPQKAPNGKQLTQAEIDMLKRMGGGDTAAPGLSGNSSGGTNRPRVGGGEGLNSEQLSKVVQNGKKNLQRCYEVALRGGGSQDTIRLDVEIEISPNGNVTAVKSGDGGLPGMKECITRTVKMWRFPSASGATATKFPLLFQPGA
jgi:hypothetical protein